MLSFLRQPWEAKTRTQSSEHGVVATGVGLRFSASQQPDWYQEVGLSSAAILSGSPKRRLGLASAIGVSED